MQNYNVPPILSAGPNGTQLFFETGDINAFARSVYNDHMGFYQSQFGVYSMMQLNTLGKYNINYVMGNPFMWQPHNSCNWTPLGTVETGQNSIEPCKVKVNAEHCYDTLFESFFERGLQWNGSGRIGLTPFGNELIDTVAETLVKNATLGNRLLLTAGQLFDSTAPLKDGVPLTIQEAFARTVGSCQGWLELLKTQGAVDGLGHLDDENIIDSGDISADGKTISNALAIYDRNVAAAKDQLYDAMIIGGVDGFFNNAMPIWLVSPSFVRAVEAEYRTIQAATAVTENRISFETFQYGGRSINVWKIDNTYVVPISDVSNYTRYMDGTYHFCYLTLSGVIQLGSDFASLPVQNENEISVYIERSTRAQDLNKTYFLSHGLVATAINDTDFIAGNQVYATP